MARAFSHCSFCGAAFPENAGWPRTCTACGRPTYRNPVPVAVVLLPVDGGLLTIRRTIDPGRGKLALPGGFINYGESWQAAGARELQEETGIHIEPGELAVFRVLSAPDGTLLLFAQAQGRDTTDLAEFAASDETSEMVVLRGPEELAFPLHTQVVEEYFAGRRK